MYAVHTKKLEKVVLFGQIIIKFSAYFNRAIWGWGWGWGGSSADQSKNQQNIWIPSQYLFSVIKSHKQILEKTGIKCRSIQKIASLGRQEPQPAGTTKWATTLRFGKILGTTSVVRSIQNHEMLSDVRFKDMISQALLAWWPYMTLKQGSKVKFDTCRRFAEQDFQEVVFSFQTPRTNDRGDCFLICFIKMQL